MHLADQIPFTIELKSEHLTGYLSPWVSPTNDAGFPLHYQVFLLKQHGHYYQGDLLFRQDKWYGCDNYKDPEALSKALGVFVEAWYE